MSNQEHGTREATIEAPAPVELPPAETDETIATTDDASLNQPSAEVETDNSATSEAGESAVGGAPASDESADAMPVEQSAEAEVDAPSEQAVEESATGDEPAENTGAAPEPAEAQPKYRRGQVYQGTICETSPTAVLVDLGEGDIGVVPGRELELMTKRMLESLVLGAEVDVYVVNPRNHRGKMVLSINHAMEEMDWRNAEKFAKSKAVYEALIGGYNKGGLIVRFGRLRGFVPQSQLSESRARQISGSTPEERYGPMVNQPIGVKVMEVDRHRNRLILSERAATREVRVKRKESLIAELTVGEIRKGTVVSLENFGAFVDIGGGEGLVHVSELAWGHITHPRQVLSLGEEIEVEVISVNPEAKRIGLSRRRVLGDPWDEIATSLRRGQLARATVTKLTKFGAFARLNDYEAVEGLIHISELSAERVEHPRDVVKRGQELVLRIIKIDIKERRLGLSLKSVNSTEYLDLDWEMAIQESVALPASEKAADALPATKEAAEASAD
ncbi:MAG: S1 RNA-binding domain-containing protein [Chloroflexi bacterium]|nr:S1 RNA-binding domain-containing protein [Chloroflexota bacterium]